MRPDGIGSVPVGGSSWACAGVQATRRNHALRNRRAVIVSLGWTVRRFVPALPELSEFRARTLHTFLKLADN